MIALIVSSVFKGTKQQFAKVLVISGCIDALIVLACSNF